MKASDETANSRASARTAEAVGRRRRCGTSRLNSEAWVAWLGSLASTDEGGALRLAGRRLTDTQSRALYRWSREDAAPTFWAADRFCCWVGTHINQFLAWSEANDLRPWAAPESPWWETEPLSEADLAQLDRLWSEPAPARGCERVAV